MTNVYHNHSGFIGTLAAPYKLAVTKAKPNTFMLSWGAPFSLNVTDYSPDIFYYILCTNITIYGCKTIPSDPDCTFPRTCTSLVDFTDPSLNEGQNMTIMHYDGPILFTFFAINGAGNGSMTNFTYDSVEGTAKGLSNYVKNCLSKLYTVHCK